MSEQQTKQRIEEALRCFSTGNLADNARNLFSALGYGTDRTIPFSTNLGQDFIETFDANARINVREALLNEWKSIDGLFQLTWDEIKASTQIADIDFDTHAKLSPRVFSYLFFAIRLRRHSYTEKELRAIACEINKLFPMSVIILFQYGKNLTLSSINRCLNKRNSSKRKEVNHIKDIPFTRLTSEVINSLFKVSLIQLHKKHSFHNFDEFHDAWQSTLNSSWKYQEESDTSDAIGQYLQNIGRIQLLRADEEIELARDIADLMELERVRDELKIDRNCTSDDAEWADAMNMPLQDFYHRLDKGRKAKEKMIASNLRLVVSIAKKYQNRGLELQDLIQEGSLGLNRAAEKFEREKGYKFSTYATWWIRQAITRAIANQSRTIRLPVHIYEKVSRIKKTTKLLSQETDRKPTEQEIAIRMEMTIENLRFITKCTQLPISLKTPMGKEEGLRLEDLIKSEEETPEERVTKNLLREDIDSFLDGSLSPRERDVLRLRYGLDDGSTKTLEEIGHIFNVTRERIRQIEAKALRKLRKFSSHHRLKDYLCS